MPEEKVLLKSTDIDALTGQEKVHFLNPNAQCKNRSLGDEVGITGFGFHIVEIEPGRDSTEFHFHYREDECVYILSGDATARIGDETFAVSAGDFLGHKKRGLAHSLTNTGNEILKCIVVGERGDTDVVDYPDKGKRMFRTAELPWNVADLSDLKDRVTGEPVPTKRDR